MAYLADSNILTALANKRSPQYSQARHAVTEIRRSGEIIFLLPQSLVEFWSVATRPAEVNGLGLDIQKTDLETRKFKRYFHFADELPGLFFDWEMLVRKYKVSGKNVHDARIVAAMMQHRLTHLLTFNTKDFKRFDQITIVDPASVPGIK